MKVFLLSLLILLMGTGAVNAENRHFSPPAPPADCDIYYEDTQDVVLVNSDKVDFVFDFYLSKEDQDANSPQFSFRVLPGTDRKLKDKDILFGYYYLDVSYSSTYSGSTTGLGRIELKSGLTIICKGG